MLVAFVMLCAILSLNLVSPLEAWFFRPVLHKDSRLLRFFHCLFNRHQPAISMAAAAGVQQGAEPVQNPPKVLEPIAEPAPGMRYIYFFLFALCEGLVLLHFRWGFFYLAGQLVGVFFSVA